MQRLAPILAQVLAVVSVAGCGGSLTSDVLDPEGNSGPSATGTATGGTAPTPPVKPPRPRDAGTPDARDSGCDPIFVRESEGSCSEYWHLPCGIPKDVDVSDGLSSEECKKVCGVRKAPGQYWGCNAYTMADLPGPSFECYTCVEGRRPQGYVEHASDPTVAGWLAHAADLERVSVDAFQILHLELAHHGAPTDLLRDVRRAERDEVRHTRAMSELARREGATLSSAPVARGAIRALVDIAVENAVEGCIRETYGALVATWQSTHASRADVRRAMKAIASDETMHADLAWRVHAWIMNRLTAAERAHVLGAMDLAVEALARGARVPSSGALVVELGLPTDADAVRLVEGLDAHLWTSALAA